MSQCKFIVVDRIEGEFAVCEMADESEKALPLSSLPNGVKEGTVLEFKDGTYVINEKEEKSRRKDTFNLQQRLFNRKKK
ncbi:MAG: DUF3006 domain-containing protein [Clostridia bacterium]|nr:DUF3006 domain-containing protein [Clostridia bacterium]